MFYLYQNKKGLTLLETTIALGILMIGILASLTLMLSSFKYIQSTEDEIVVVNLAREGIELVRSIRNNNSAIADSEPSKIDIFSGDYDNESYFVDSQSNNTLSTFNTLNYASLDNCENCKLYLDSNGRYSHTFSPSAQETVFKRTVTISPSDSAYEKVITSTVSWQVKGRVSTFSLEARLTDWQAD